MSHGRPPRPDASRDAHPLDDEAEIPFNRPFIAGKELFYIAQAVLGAHLAGEGPFTQRCAAWMERSFGATRALLTHSCTAALEMSAVLSDIGPGDEVIMPSYTFVSTANAFALQGARIRFVDVRPDTLNLDETLVEAAITPRTKVICVVHYAGVGAEMDALMAIAARRGLRVVEDAAQGVDATYRGRHLGTLGHLGCYSFHETKNYIAGEGGALVVNDPRLVERAEIIREKGTNRTQFRRGEVDRYTWVDLGSSYLPSELTAAFLYAQLEVSAEITRRRHAIHAHYEAGFERLAARGLVRRPVVPSHCRHNAHMYYLLVDAAQRDPLLAHLRARGIHAVFHYVPLHSAPMSRRLGFDDVDLPVTDDVARRLVRLPCFFELTPGQQDRVIAEVERFFGVSGAEAA